MSCINRNGVACRILVYTRGAVTNPLTPCVHWYTNVEFDLTHLEWCSVRVPHEIPNQAAILVKALVPIRTRFAQPARLLHHRPYSQEA